VLVADVENATQLCYKHHNWLEFENVEGENRGPCIESPQIYPEIMEQYDIHSTI